LADALGVPLDVARAIKVDPEFKKLLYPNITGAAVDPAAYFAFKQRLHAKALADASNTDRELGLGLIRYNEYVDRQAGTLQPLQAQIRVDNTFHVIMQQGDSVPNLFRANIPNVASLPAETPITVDFQELEEAQLARE
jgi:hypothetical protein